MRKAQAIWDYRWKQSAWKVSRTDKVGWMRSAAGSGSDQAGVWEQKLGGTAPTRGMFGSIPGACCVIQRVRGAGPLGRGEGAGCARARWLPTRVCLWEAGGHTLRPVPPHPPQGRTEGKTCAQPTRPPRAPGELQRWRRGAVQGSWFRRAAHCSARVRSERGARRARTGPSRPRRGRPAIPERPRPRASGGWGEGGEPRRVLPGVGSPSLPPGDSALGSLRGGSRN